MKKIYFLVTLLTLILCLHACGDPGKTGASGQTGDSAGEGGARIGTLTCIGMTEEDVKQWTADVAVAEGKEAGYVNNNTIIFYDNLDAMIMALINGDIDRFSIGSRTAKYIADRNDKLEYADRKHKAVLGYCIAMKEERSQTIEKINAAIREMKEDGSLDSLQQKYIDDLGREDPQSVAMPVFEEADTIKVAVTGDLPPMDVILEDGSPAGFNTAFFAELSKRIHMNIELVSIDSAARATALASDNVDALFWTRGVYDENGEELPYPLDRMEGISISDPYLIESRDAVKLK